MKYIITQKQYVKIIQEAAYGDLINVGAPTSTKGGSQYGDLVGGTAAAATATAGQGSTSAPAPIKIFSDKSETSLDGTYNFKDIRKTDDKKGIIVNFKEFTLTTDCEKLKKNDNSFAYSGGGLKYVKQLIPIIQAKNLCK